MPPLVGVAVNIILVPVQMVVAEAPIFTDGVTERVTIIVSALLVAVGEVAQERLLVITTVTTSLLFNEDDEKVLLFVPALLPFTFH